MRKLFLKIKRYFFYKRNGFYPEDLKKLVYASKYLEKFNREDKSYNEYLKDHFNASE